MAKKDCKEIYLATIFASYADKSVYFYLDSIENTDSTFIRKYFSNCIFHIAKEDF